MKKLKPEPVKCDHCANEAKFWGYNRKSYLKDCQFMCQECAKNPVFTFVKPLRTTP